MRLPVALAVVLAAVVLPAGATAQSGFDGTYSGTSDEGQQITVEIVRGELSGIRGAALLTVLCTREDGTQPFPNDRVAVPPPSGPFPVETTLRGSVRNSQFLVGTKPFASDAERQAAGDHVESSAEGRFALDGARKPIVRLSLAYEAISDSAPGKRTRCSTGATATLARTSAGGAGANGRRVTLRSPTRQAISRVTAVVPGLAALGDAGIGVRATTRPGARGGRLEVAVRRDPGVRDELGLGSGSLGSASARTRGSGSVGLSVAVKRPRRTPAKGDEIRLLLTVTFTDRRGRSRSATTSVVVRG